VEKKVRPIQVELPSSGRGEEGPTNSGRIAQFRSNCTVQVELPFADQHRRSGTNPVIQAPPKAVEEKKVRPIQVESMLKEDESEKLQVRNVEALIFMKDRPSQKRAVMFPPRMADDHIDDIFEGIM
jgi:hypothetical protein